MFCIFAPYFYRIWPLLFPSILILSTFLPSSFFLLSWCSLLNKAVLLFSNDFLVPSILMFSSLTKLFYSYLTSSSFPLSWCSLLRKSFSLLFELVILALFLDTAFLLFSNKFFFPSILMFSFWTKLFYSFLTSSSFHLSWCFLIVQSFSTLFWRVPLSFYPDVLFLEKAFLLFSNEFSFPSILMFSSWTKLFYSFLTSSSFFLSWCSLLGQRFSTLF